MTDNVLSITGMHKSFGGLQVINAVSMDVQRGSRTALIGPNGAGKTTVFNLLTGVYPIDAGTVVLDGVDVSHVPSQDRVIHGMSRSFQNIRLMPHLSTVENVMLGQHARARSLRDLMFPSVYCPKTNGASKPNRPFMTPGSDPIRAKWSLIFLTASKNASRSYGPWCPSPSSFARRACRRAQ